MKKRVALYIRVSTEEQTLHGDSLDAQEKALIEYAEKNDYTIVKIYRDEGFSARKPAITRHAMQEMLCDAQDNKFDMILFTKMDRWFRNVKEYYKVQEVLDKCKIDWKTILEDYDTTSADGRLKINIMLSVAENEADRTSERIKFVNEMKIKKKEPITGVQPFGYKIAIVDGKKCVIKDPEKVETVERIFDHFLTYKSGGKTQIFMLEEFGIKRTRSSVIRLLKTEQYTGTYRGVADYCPPYITHEQHREILRIICGQLDTRTPFPKNFRNNYLFTGLITCPVCGKKLTARVKSPCGRSKRYYISYRCWRYANHQCENNHIVSQSVLERWLLDNIEEKLKDYEIKIKLEHSTPKKRPDDQIKKLKDRLSRLNDSYELGNIERDEYIQKTTALKAQINALSEENVIDDRKSIEELKSVITSDFRSNYELLSAENKRALWVNIIKEIKVEGTKPVDIIFL